MVQPCRSNHGSSADKARSQRKSEQPSSLLNKRRPELLQFRVWIKNPAVRGSEAAGPEQRRGQYNVRTYLCKIILSIVFLLNLPVTLFCRFAGSIWGVCFMTTQDSCTSALLDRAASGDSAARAELLDRHRARLRQMVAVHIDRRLAARVDPSDVVQEALLDAANELPRYLEGRPIPFYPWLRQLAWERLVELHRRHIHAQKRSVQREEARSFHLPDESAFDLADRLVAAGASPISNLLREEQRDRVHQALAGLGQRDQEILVLRHLEQLSIAEIAAVLHLREGAVKTRLLRALMRFRELLLAKGKEDQT